jgi:hypothetical protein
VINNIPLRAINRTLLFFDLITGDFELPAIFLPVIAQVGIKINNTGMVNTIKVLTEIITLWFPFNSAYTEDKKNVEITNKANIPEIL